MYLVDSLENTITNLYHASSCTLEEAEEMLAYLDFPNLLQWVKDNNKTVYAYTTYGNWPRGLNYRGEDLFRQQAALLYDVPGQNILQNDVASSRSMELWLLADMSLVVTSCWSVSLRKGFYTTQYRQIKGDPWESGMCLNLEKLIAQLHRHGQAVCRNRVPFYEL